MGTHENVRKICEYLQALGFSSASERIQEGARSANTFRHLVSALQVKGSRKLLHKASTIRLLWSAWR